MHSIRLLFVLALALGGAFSLFTSVAEAAASAPTQAGPMAGVWESPSPNQPGRAKGLLADQGAPAYVLQAVVKRDPSAPLPKGQFHGRLLDPATANSSNPTVLAHGHGQWIDGPKGPGHFRGVILTPDPTGNGGPVLAGKLEGRFFQPPLGPGQFQGHYVFF